MDSFVVIDSTDAAVVVVAVVAAAASVVVVVVAAEEVNIVGCEDHHERVANHCRGLMIRDDPDPQEW